MSISLRSLLMLIVLGAALASCSPEAAPPTTARTVTGAAQIEAPGVQATMVGTPQLTATSSATVALPATARPQEKSSTAAPPGSQSTAVAAFGVPVGIGRGGIRDASFSPDRKTLAIGWTNGVSLTRVEDQADLWYWKAPEMLTAVAASDRHVGVLLVNGDVWLLDAENGAGQEFVEAALVPGGDAYWGDVAWSPDGSLAAIQAIGGADTGATPILLLDPAARKIAELEGTQTDPGSQPYLVWSPDSRLVSSVDREGHGVVLDVTSGEVVFRASPAGSGVSPRIYGWTPDGRVVVHGAGGNHNLRLEEVGTGKVVRILTGAQVGFVPTPPVVISPAGDLALVGGYSVGEYQIQPYQVWDLKLGRPLDVPPVGELRHINSAGCMELHRPAVAFDGSEVVYFDTDGRFVRWKIGAAQGEILGSIPVHYPCLGTPLVWSDDSARLVLETDPGQAITLWDAASGQLIAERRDGTYPADLHGEVLAYRGADGELILWDVRANNEIARLAGPVTSFKLGVRFSPDGQQIAYGVGNLLHIADAESGDLLSVLNGYPEGQQISQIDWAPGGDAIAAASGSSRGNEGGPGLLILWERAGESFVEALRIENVQASMDWRRVKLSSFSSSGQLVALMRMPEPVAGQEAAIVYDRLSKAVILEKQGYLAHQWSSDEGLLLTKGCSFIEVNVRTGEERRGSGESCQAELGAFAPDGLHFSSILFSGRSMDILNWRTGQVEAARYVGSDLQDGIFSPDGSWLAVRALEGMVRVFPIHYTVAHNP